MAVALSEETGIPWQTIANTQARAYNLPENLTVPLPRHIGMQGYPSSIPKLLRSSSFTWNLTVPVLNSVLKVLQV